MIKDGIELKEHECEECGVTFYSKGKLQVVLCYECKKEHNRMMTKRRNIIKNKRKNPDYVPREEIIKPPKPVKRVKPFKSLNECVIIVENYNKEHGTLYSYGNFPYKEMFN